MNLLTPEIIVTITAFTVLISDLFISEDSANRKAILSSIALLGLFAALGVIMNMLPCSGSAFGGRFVMDSVAGWFKISFLLGGAFTVALVWNNKKHEALEYTGEFLSIMLFTLVGMCFLISARDLITLYISLELATIPLFALAAWKRGDSLSSEAGLKYVVYGALASGLLLYGLGLLYGITGQSELALIREGLVTTTPLFWLSVALITAGIGFKLTLVPFHMWAADVYQGAPTPVTAYLSVASKAAGLAFSFQMFYQIMGAQLAEWLMFLAILAAATMTLGNLAAIVQNNIKRFMAFSAISQAGYLIMGFLGPYDEGVAAMLFYMLIYVFSNMAVFGVIIFFSDNTGKDKIADYNGLSRRNPLVAFAMMIALFSLAGIPPLSGFVGKFFLFSLAAKADLNWLVAVAALNSTVSLYYYLRIIRAMYMEKPDENAGALPVTSVMRVTLIVATIAIIALGVMPQYYETIFSQTTGWLASL